MEEQELKERLKNEIKQEMKQEKKKMNLKILNKIKKLEVIIKEILLIVAIIIGIASVVEGIIIALNTYSSGTIDSAKFGADFYTEIYSAVRSTGNTLKSLYFIIRIGVISFFIMFGIIDICYFGLKLVDQIEKRRIEK